MSSDHATGKGVVSEVGGISWAATLRAMSACEDASRAFAAACTTIVQAGNDRRKNQLANCSHVALATAGILRRFDRQDIETVVFQVEVCQRAAAACADACTDELATPAFEQCAGCGRACADACTALLGALKVDAAVILLDEAPESQLEQTVDEEDEVSAIGGGESAATPR